MALFSLSTSSLREYRLSGKVSIDSELHICYAPKIVANCPVEVLEEVAKVGFTLSTRKHYLRRKVDKEPSFAIEHETLHLCRFRDVRYRPKFDGPQRDFGNKSGYRGAFGIASWNAVPLRVITGASGIGKPEQPALVGLVGQEVQPCREEKRERKCYRSSKERAPIRGGGLNGEVLIVWGNVAVRLFCVNLTRIDVVRNRKVVFFGPVGPILFQRFRNS